MQAWDLLLLINTTLLRACLRGLVARSARLSEKTHGEDNDYRRIRRSEQLIQELIFRRQGAGHRDIYDLLEHLEKR
jgi:hypothetical protein